MKPVTNSTTIEGDLTGQKVKMQIDSDAVAHVMNALVNLYSDNEMAVIREIATNARDAHIEAGTAHLPIEVSTPKNGYGQIPDPFFRVRDYGPGLSVDDITNIYSKYGASTKRDTNEQTGSLGFGCKSPLAYTDQFNLTSVCNGVRIVVLVSKDDDGGNMQIIDTRSTDEPSGVTIEVPVARYNNFEQKAQKLFSFWEAGTVLINGREPEPIKGRKISDDITIVYGGSDYVIMGNVPYPINTEHFKSDLNDGYHVVVRVPIGDVEFVPSREAMKYSTITRDRLKQVEVDFGTAIQTVVQKSIDECDDRASVIATICEWRRTLPETRIGQQYTYKGRKVPIIYEIPGAKDGARAFISEYGYCKKSAHQRRERLDISWWPKTLFVYGYDREGFTAPTKNKLEKYRNDNSLKSVDRFILLPKKPSREFTQWLAKDRQVDWETIRAIKLPRSYAGGRSQVDRIPGSYDMFVDGDWKQGVPANDIDQTKAIFYFNGKREGINRWVPVLRRHYPGCTVVVMGENRIEKFKRSFPQSTWAIGSAKAMYPKWVKTLTPNEKLSLMLHHGLVYYERDAFKAIDPTKVDDPEIAKLARIASKTGQKTLTGDRFALAAEIWLEFYRVLLSEASASKLVKDWKSPLEERYPLFDTHTHRTSPDHVYMYLNAMYAFTNKAK